MEENNSFNKRNMDFTRKNLEREIRDKEKEINSLRSELGKKESQLGLEKEISKLNEDYRLELSRDSSRDRIRVEAEKDKNINTLKTKLDHAEGLLEETFKSRVKELEIIKSTIDHEIGELDRRKFLNEKDLQKLHELEEELSEKKKAQDENEVKVRNKKAELHANQLRLERRKDQLEEEFLRKTKEYDNKVKEYEKKVKELDLQVAEYRDKLIEKNRLISENSKKITETGEALKDSRKEKEQFEYILSDRNRELAQVEEKLKYDERKIKKIRGMFNRRKTRGREVAGPGMMKSKLVLSSYAKHEEDMAKVKELIIGIGHQLRNPLSIIGSNAQFCLDKIRLKNQVRKSIDIILRNVKLASLKLEKLVKYSQPLYLNLKKGSLYNCLGRVCLLIEERCKGQDVRLVREISTELPIVKHDQGKIEEAFLNIMFNSLEAMPEGGKLTIRAEVDEEANEVVVYINDTGQSISEHNLKNVMDPFFTTRDGAVGLGLSIANRIVGLHMGKIEIESEKDSGTIVKLRFPVAHNK